MQKKFVSLPAKARLRAKGIAKRTVVRCQKNRMNGRPLYCTLTALICKSLIMIGAGEGNRTLVSGLGSPRSTIEPHPPA